ncbi:neuropilin and tolloid-like protein 1 [Elysia marginata]|uniref:Neuropilin and tolloid-like protein 1 n=1 Tax=Elysia marginata TaxID=1093978 RepID=A0AAV4J4M6_9GAST|nr:neuropilin and tolloid-like protein 1 [Elysia marginata]
MADFTKDRRPNHDQVMTPDLRCLLAHGRLIFKTRTGSPTGFRISLDFQDKFVMEKSVDCQYDYLEVRDGPFAYSPLIGRYCDAGFPSKIMSSYRHLWLRFKTDGLLQYDGFKAVYGFIKDDTQNDGAITEEGELPPLIHDPSPCRIPVKLSPNKADGILSSDQVPFGDISDPRYPKGHSVDCTWEIYTERSHKINLRSSKINIKSRKRCDVSNVTIYERTTLDSAITKEFCSTNNKHLDKISKSNRVFVRVFGSTLAEKPNVQMVYSLVREGGPCSEDEIACGRHCLPISLRCNGMPNCPDSSDEMGCPSRIPPGEDLGDTDQTRMKEKNDSDSFVPLHILILGAVGGVILCGVTISLCIMCHLRRKERNKPKSASTNGSGSRAPPAQRNALEMAVNNSNTTSISLYKQSNDGRATMSGLDRPYYFSKMNSASPSSSRDVSAHRYSLTDRGGLSDSDVIHADPIMTESGNYKKYLGLDLSADDGTGMPGVDESMHHHHHHHHFHPSTPSTPGGIMGMTSLDYGQHPHHHRIPDVYPGYHGSGGPQWHSALSDDSGMYSYGSLTRPTPFLGMSKPFTYGQPEGKFESKYLTALKALESEANKDPRPMT